MAPGMNMAAAMGTRRAISASMRAKMARPAVILGPLQATWTWCHRPCRDAAPAADLLFGTAGAGGPAGLALGCSAALGSPLPNRREAQKTEACAKRASKTDSRAS